MDYIREFDIRLDKEMFYAGEILEGHVVLDTIENFKLKSKLQNENNNFLNYLIFICIIIARPLLKNNNLKCIIYLNKKY